MPRVRQGQKIATVRRNGEKAEVVSPIGGEVTGLNEAALKDPALLARDPNVEVWLVTVQAPDAKTSFRNLLSGTLARRWMEEAAARFRTRMSDVAGAMAQDGGVAVENLAEHLPGEGWDKLAREFFPK